MKKKRALIVTVGTGTRPDVYIVKPLVKSIKDSRPDFLLLVTTKTSREYGEAIIKEIGIGKDVFKIAETKDFDDFQSVFRDINNEFFYLAELGYAPDEIQLDFTSGTKAMSSGAILSAIYNKCRSIKYITGERRNGVVMDGTEKFSTIDPENVFTLHDINLAKEFLILLRFAAAKQLLKDITTASLTNREKLLVGNLLHIADGYEKWDVFDHKNAWNCLKKVDWESLNAHHLRPGSECWDMLEKLAKSENKRDEGEVLLIDLYNNALRREREGRFDDAVARLYRAVEMFAQHILKIHYQIDTADVKMSKVPEKMRGLLLSRQNEKSEKVRIGLYHDYLLLKELGHAAGRFYIEDKSIQGRLKERNTSILAHGITPASQTLLQKLHAPILEMFKMEIPDFEDKARKMQFPWLKIP